MPSVHSVNPAFDSFDSFGASKKTLRSSNKFHVFQCQAQKTVTWTSPNLDLYITGPWRSPDIDLSQSNLWGLTLDVRDDPELDKNQIGLILFQQYISPDKGLFTQ